MPDLHGARLRLPAILFVILALLAALPAYADGMLGTVRFNERTIAGTPGFFRVGQSTTGRWWLIDPNGQAFFYRGVCAVNRPGTPGGRRARRGPYADRIDAKYGVEPGAFAAAEMARLRSWGFNALGAWTLPEFFEQGMPYTDITEFTHTGPALAGKNVRLPDVFDPAWAAAIDARAREICAPRRDSIQLIGYFTDNELGWAQMDAPDEDFGDTTLASGKVRPSLLQICLSQEPNRSASFAAWQFVMRRHGGNLPRVARDWGVTLDSYQTLCQWTRDGKAIVSRGYRRDDQDFSRLFAGRYFRLSAEAIRKYDPNHLILGCRFGAPPGPAVLAAMRRPWVDVVSANNYRDSMYERMDAYYQGTGLPVLNTEFGWYSGYFTQKAIPDQPQGGSAADRVTYYGPRSLERALTHPAVIGYTWYRWVDNAGSKPPVSPGLVSIADEPNPLHTVLLSDLNARADTLALSAAPPQPVRWMPVRH